MRHLSTSLPKYRVCLRTLLFVFAIAILNFAGAQTLNAKVDAINEQIDRDRKAYAHFMMGLIFDRQREPDKGIAEYNKALEYNEGASWIYLRIAQDYLNLYF